MTVERTYWRHTQGHIANTFNGVVGGAWRCLNASTQITKANTGHKVRCPERSWPMRSLRMPFFCCLNVNVAKVAARKSSKGQTGRSKAWQGQSIVSGWKQIKCTIPDIVSVRSKSKVALKQTPTFWWKQNRTWRRYLLLLVQSTVSGWKRWIVIGESVYQWQLWNRKHLSYNWLFLDGNNSEAQKNCSLDRILTVQKHSSYNWLFLDGNKSEARQNCSLDWIPTINDPRGRAALLRRTYTRLFLDGNNNL